MVESVFAGRIEALRAAMAARGIDACVVVSSDPHLSEYLPGHWHARQWLSGFEGSAGTLVVTAGFAGLWTDSRYWEQAAHALEGTGIETMRAGEQGVMSFIDWIAAQLPEGSRVSIDGRVVGLQAYRQWQATLTPKGISLVCDVDLVGAIWADRPALPQAPVFEHASRFAGRSRSEKLAAVRAAMAGHNAGWHWISSLDDIAWLFNLRGSDVSYNPVFMAYALIGRETARLFVDQAKIGASLRKALLHDGIEIEPYADAASALARLPGSESLLLDPVRTTTDMLGAASSVKVVEAVNPSHLLKSRKTEVELSHIRHAMEKDGAALCEFFAWFESALGNDRITEITIDEKITAARARQPDFVSPSFGTIAAFNANGAMPHYQATEQSHALIQGDGLLLIDSGGQYLDGTTDITRVVPVGKPSDAQKRDYTTVLKGMIALSMAVFPRGTAAPSLDVLARLPIWQAGAEFGHGTGHGVGYFLNVHEGPQAISYRTKINENMGMEPGMITSNEPGLYRPGRWGIRIENLVVNRPAMTTEFGEFLKFETLTLCPIDTRCIERSLLNDAERAWLDGYHSQVRSRLFPFVDGAAKEWLSRRTEPV